MCHVTHVNWLCRDSTWNRHLSETTSFEKAINEYCGRDRKLKATRHKWMCHVTHVNWMCHVTRHVTHVNRMCHVTHVNRMCHVTHVNRHLPETTSFEEAINVYCDRDEELKATRRKFKGCRPSDPPLYSLKLPVTMSHVTCMNVSWHTHQYVLSHI